VKRRIGYLSLLLAVLCSVLGAAVRGLEGGVLDETVAGIPLETLATQGLLVATIVLATLGGYVLVSAAMETLTEDKRRRHDIRNLVRFLFLTVAVVGLLSVLTRQYVGLLFSLGVVGFAVTFALQQPLFSLISWIYIMLKRPYSVGLSSHVYNYSYQDFPHVWDELAVEVAYETDLEFARQLMVEEATDYLGEEMERAIEQYRERLARTPVELEVRERPTVNVSQETSWVSLRLRYLVHPRRGQRVRNDLYERILDRMNDHPDRVAFPVSRNRWPRRIGPRND
jgi:small-conductance mechanosensitive channel